MALYIKDPEVDRLVERLATHRGTTKTEVVRQALRHEAQSVDLADDMVDQILALTRDLKKRAGPGATGTVDKAFIDDLYE